MPYKFFRSEATAMVCSYSLYLVIMFFNPRIEKWLYRITNTTSPEFKSDLHASNDTNSPKNEGYSKLAIDEKVETSEEDNDQEPEKCQQQQEEIRVPKPLEGKFCSSYFMLKINLNSAGKYDLKPSSKGLISGR